MKNYYRVMLGKKSVHAQECFSGNFIGADYSIRQDLSAHLPDDWRQFNHKFIPLFQEVQPGKSKVAAGLACAALWTVAKGIRIGDIVLCPAGTRQYRAGEITGEYSYQPDGILPHRRPVRWLPQGIDRSEMSEALRNSTGAIGTVSNITKHAAEIEALLGGTALPTLISTDETVEDLAAFVMEKHLEDFLVRNWAGTELGKSYDIYADAGELIGQQFLTDTGPLDILAISKDRKTLLVVELKKGRASDVVVGQILRYMAYVQDELAEDWQSVRGVIIAHEDDQRICRALSMTPSIEFYRYEISFKLLKV